MILYDMNGECSWWMNWCMCCTLFTEHCSPASPLLTRKVSEVGRACWTSSPPPRYAYSHSQTTLQSPPEWPYQYLRQCRAADPQRACPAQWMTFRRCIHQVSPKVVSFQHVHMMSRIDVSINRYHLISKDMHWPCTFRTTWTELGIATLILWFSDIG